MKVFNIKKNRAILIIFLLVVASFVILFLPNLAFAEEYTASDLGGGVNGFIMSASSNFLLALMNALGAYILLPLINMVTNLVQFNHFVDSQAVEIGWKLVRDLSNMFFVVILLIIAFSTILKISNYHYKNILFKVLLMAILVNFSKTIMGFLIDFGQVIMLTFVNAFSGSAAPIIIKNLMVTELLNIEPDAADLPDKWSIFAALLLGVVMLVVAIGVMLAYVAVLLYRIISLWILILLSPLAFVLSSFNGSAKYASEFWNKFWNQLSTGIILAFFMWLSFSILTQASNQGAGIGDILNNGTTSSQTQATEKTTPVGIEWEGLFTYIVTIALFLMALQYAQQAGGFAGSFAGKVSGSLQKMGSAPFRGAKKAGAGVVRFGTKGAKTLIGSGVDKLHQKTGVDMNLKRVWGEFQTAREAKKRREYTEGRGVASTAMREGKFIRSRLASATGGIAEHFDTYSYWKGLGKLLHPKGVGKSAQIRSERMVEQAQLQSQKADYLNNILKRGGVGNEYLRNRGQEIVDQQYNLSEDYEKTGNEKKKEEIQKQKNNLSSELRLINFSTFFKDLKIDDLDDDQKLISYVNDNKNKIDDEYSSTNELIISLDNNEQLIRDAAKKDGRELTFEESQEIEQIDSVRKQEKTKLYLLNSERQYAQRFQDLIKDNQIDSLRKNIEDKLDNVTKYATNWNQNRLETINKNISGLQKENLGRDLTLKEESQLNDLELEKKTIEAQIQFNPFIDNNDVNQLKKDIETARGEEAKFLVKASKVAPTAGFYEQEARRTLEAEEMKKLMGTENDAELINIFREAQARGNKARMAAALRKLAMDYNDNEAFNAFGYGSGYEGMRNFFEKEVKDKGKFTEQQMLSLANDISYINESRGHYNTSRMATMENGKWRWFNHEEHDMIAGIELGKKDDRSVAKLNRLAFGYEKSNGEYVLDSLGALQLRLRAKNWVENTKLVNEHMTMSIIEKMLMAEQNDKSVSKALEGLTYLTEVNGVKKEVPLSSSLIQVFKKRMASASSVADEASKIHNPDFGYK